MEIDGGDGIDCALKIQRIFHHGDAASVVASEVFLMRLHIHGELAQARRQIFESGGKLRQGVWQGQVEQDAGGGHNENGSGRKLWRGGESHLALLHARQGGAGALNVAEGEVGVGADEAGGKAQRRFVAVKVGRGDRCGGLYLAAEIGKFGAGNGAQVRVRNGRYSFGCMSRREGCVHKRHWQKKRLRFLGRSAVRFSRILWACSILRNGPAATEFFRPGNAPVAREFLHAALRKLPSFGCFCHADISHDALLLHWVLIVL